MSLSIASRRSSRRLRRVFCWRLFIINLRVMAGSYANTGLCLIVVRPQTPSRWYHYTGRFRLPDRCQQRGTSILRTESHCTEGLQWREIRTGLRLAITGGGTGGHVLPALAVVDDLRQRGALADLIWIGSSEGVERQAAAEAGISFVAIPTGKLRRLPFAAKPDDAARIPLGVLAARRALAAFRPDVVLSTGGFVSVPTVVAARGIAPVLTHEQTAILGLANRINARFADVLAVSHHQTEPTARRLHRRVLVTGNPIRVGLSAGDRCTRSAIVSGSMTICRSSMSPAAREARVRSINESPKLLPGILDRTQIVHQTGPLTANADAGNLTRASGSAAGEPFVTATT